MTRRGAIRIYGIAHFGKSLLWNTSSLYFAFYLTEVAGLAPDHMGQIIALSLFFNAACDLVLGRILGRMVRNSAAAAAMQQIGAALAASGFVAFSFSPLVPAAAITIFSLSALLLFRLGYSLYDVPQNSFMAFFASCDVERADMAATRYVASGLSILLITGLLAPLVQVSDPLVQGQLFIIMAGLFATLAFGSAWLLRAVQSAGAGHADGAVSPVAKCAHQAYPDKARTRMYGLLLGGILILSSCSPLFTKLESYFTAYVIGGGALAYFFMPMVACGQIIGQAIWPRLVRSIGLVRVLGWAAMCWIATAMAFWAAAQSGSYALVPIGLVYGMAWGGVAMALWSLLTKSCEHVPHLTTRRFGQFTFISKCAQAGAILLLGEALASMNYQNNDDGASITVLMAGGPIIGGLLIGGLSMLLAGKASSKSGLTC